ncbi:hypothetical protein, partial [Enterobacter roggenkampii]
SYIFIFFQRKGGHPSWPGGSGGLGDVKKRQVREGRKPPPGALMGRVEEQNFGKVVFRVGSKNKKSAIGGVSPPYLFVKIRYIVFNYWT